MEQRLANTWRMTINEKKFIEIALQSDLRIDGRSPFDYRKLLIKFGREDGSSEVQLGQTHVMGFVTSQLVQPFRDRPNEGTLAIYTEFSPMADPSFEVGRPGESAVELARIIDRGLRESRAVDTESLCVVAGKLVWAIRVDLHILDNGGNLVDAANIAALAALLTFRRPECSLGGEDGQEVVVHPPEVREPLPLIVHHLPIAVTFAFIGSEDAVVIDPTHLEEAVMGGRMTATLNMNGDVCAIQKAGGDGIMQSVIFQCLRIALVKAGDMTTKIKTAVSFFFPSSFDASASRFRSCTTLFKKSAYRVNYARLLVESYNTARALRKVKRHTPATAVSVGETDQKEITDFSSNHMEKLKLIPEVSTVNKNDAMDVDTEKAGINNKNRENKVKSFTGGPSSWDPYSKKGVDAENLRATLASKGATTAVEKPENNRLGKSITDESDELPIAPDSSHAPLVDTTGAEQQVSGKKTLMDAVKPKHKRKKKSSSSSGAS
ncbi:exoribonuclease [Lithospermum erythrorhizon]|uniref:Protein ECERIFERUM 7 n=1 Tax=Lithospermum erythrorhizon TaxID=34254 RepID=A0AAV3QVJ3_LITER